MAFSFFRKKDDTQVGAEQKSTLSTLNKPAVTTGGLSGVGNDLSRPSQAQGLSANRPTGSVSASAAITKSAAGSASAPRLNTLSSGQSNPRVNSSFSRNMAGAGGLSASSAFPKTAASAVKPAATAGIFASAPKPAVSAVSRPASSFGAARPNTPGTTSTLAETKARFESLKTKNTFNSRNPDVVPQRAPRPTGKPNVNKDVSDVQYRRFSAFIEDKCGIVLGTSRQYLVNSRLSGLLSRFKVDTVDDLINIAMEEKPNNAAQDAVIDAMTTNETLWFRDTYPYLALQNIILPELAMKGKDYGVRIWSAACSSGQEPYSIAMVIQEQMTHMVHIDPNKAQIVGTDLSPDMLAHCRMGIYDAHALSRGLSLERRAKFFKPSGKPNQMKVDTRIKSMVEFRPLNLLGSFALMGKFDVIFCRNVLIYFSNDVKSQILNKLTMCLNPRGYLILGSSESLTGVAEKYEMIRCAPGIIYRLKPSKF